jgi:hypothetical protein
MRESRFPSEHESRIQWWRRLIVRQQSATVPLVQFCRQVGINTRKFYTGGSASGKSMGPAEPAKSAHRDRHDRLALWPRAQRLPSCRYQSSVQPQPLSWRSNSRADALYDSPARLTPSWSKLQSALLDSSTALAGETTDVCSAPRRGASFPLHQTNGYAKRVRRSLRHGSRASRTGSPLRASLPQSAFVPRRSRIPVSSAEITALPSRTRRPV